MWFPFFLLLYNFPTYDKVSPIFVSIINKPSVLNGFLTNLLLTEVSYRWQIEPTSCRQSDTFETTLELSKFTVIPLNSFMH